MDCIIRVFLAGGVLLLCINATPVRWYLMLNFPVFLLITFKNSTRTKANTTRTFQKMQKQQKGTKQPTSCVQVLMTSKFYNAKAAAKDNMLECQ